MWAKRLKSFFLLAAEKVKAMRISLTSNSVWLTTSVNNGILALVCIILLSGIITQKSLT
jgi:hypothetical protein